MSQQKPKKPFNTDKTKKPKGRNKALLYSNMGFQLLAYIAIGVFIGHKVDEHYAYQTPYGTAVGALVGIVLGFYSVLRDLL